MIDKKELYNIAEFILNKADERELQVIEEALKRRLAKKNKAFGGMDINYLAHSTGDAVSKQLSASKEQIRETVTGFVKNIIREHAPEISEDELNVLLDEWVPDPEAGKKSAGNEKRLPDDVVLKMIDQFLRFNSGEMSLDEQKLLRDSIPQWQEEYWKRFPQKIRGLLTLYIKGKIDSGTCWVEIKKELFSGEQQKNEKENK